MIIKCEIVTSTDFTRDNKFQPLALFSAEYTKLYHYNIPCCHWTLDTALIISSGGFTQAVHLSTNSRCLSVILVFLFYVTLYFYFMTPQRKILYFLLLVTFQITDGDFEFECSFMG